MGDKWWISMRDLAAEVYRNRVVYVILGLWGLLLLGDSLVIHFGTPDLNKEWAAWTSWGPPENRKAEWMAVAFACLAIVTLYGCARAMQRHAAANAAPSAPQAPPPNWGPNQEVDAPILRAIQSIVEDMRTHRFVTEELRGRVADIDLLDLTQRIGHVLNEAVTRRRLSEECVSRGLVHDFACEEAIQLWLNYMLPHGLISRRDTGLITIMGHQIPGTNIVFRWTPQFGTPFFRHVMSLPRQPVMPTSR